MKVRLRDGSGWRHYKHVVEDTDRHGNVRLYFRRKGLPKIRLTETLGTPAFEQEYLRAFRGEIFAPARQGAAHTAPAPGTMRWLAEQYYASAAFQALGDSTRKVRRSILDAICERAGTFRFA